jgi:hypothetical protein
VTQASTKTTNPQSPHGICFNANFADLPESLQWFRMAIDGTEVTAKMTWITKTQGTETIPSTGTGCYAPADGIAVGTHDIAVSVSNPTNTSEPVRYLVQWEVEVTP